jgi:hypothetical protein
MIEWIAAGSVLAAVGADGPWRPTPYQLMGRAEPLEVGFHGKAWSTNRKDWSTPEHEEALRQIWAALRGLIPIHIVFYNADAFDGTERSLPRYTKSGRVFNDRIPEIVVLRGPVRNPSYQRKYLAIDVSIARGSLFDPAHGHVRVPWMRNAGEEMLSKIDATLQATHVPFADWAYEHAPMATHLHEPGTGPNLRNLWAVTGNQGTSLPFGDKSARNLYHQWPEQKEWFRFALQKIDDYVAGARHRAYTNDMSMRRWMKRWHEDLDPASLIATRARQKALQSGKGLARQQALRRKKGKKMR